MRQALAWLAVVLLPIVVWGGLAFARRDPNRRNWELPTQMLFSPAYKSQTANPVLPGNMTMQPPVPGTLQRGIIPLHYGAGEAGQKRAGQALRSAPAATPQALLQGRQVYRTFCAVCHGAQGRGDGPIVLKSPNSPDLLSPAARQLSNEEMFQITTMGRESMPAYASQVPADDRWRVILYVDSLRKGGR